MRPTNIALVLGASGAVACTNETIVAVPICNEVASSPVAWSYETAFGDSGESLVEQLADFEQAVEVSTADGESVADVYHWKFGAGQGLRVVTLAGTSPWASQARCPSGDVLEVPVEITLHSEMGLDMQGVGRVWIGADTGERWFETTTYGTSTGGVYAVEAPCGDSGFEVFELAQASTLFDNLASEPGLDGMSGGFSVGARSGAATCGQSVATWRAVP